MWFYPHAKELLAANKGPLEGDDAMVIAEIDGVEWTGANTSSWNGITSRTRGGAWTDQGIHLDWNDLCGKWEDKLLPR